MSRCWPGITADRREAIGRAATAVVRLQVERASSRRTTT